MRLAAGRAAVLLASLIPSSSGEDVYTCNYNTAGAGGIGHTSPVVGQGGKCQFPFTMSGILYNACTTTRITEEDQTGRPADSMVCGGGTCAAWCPTVVGTGGSIDAGDTGDNWGYCTCPEPVPAPDASAAAATVATARVDTALQLPYNQCLLPHAVTPCSGDSKPVVTWKSGLNGYTIFILRYAEIPYTKPNGDAGLSVGNLNAHLVVLRRTFARYAKLDQTRAGCVGTATCDGLTLAKTPPRCDPFPVADRCKLDLWRVKVFAPFTRGSLVIKVHIAPPAAILDRPTTVIARLDPARVRTARRANSGPLQVSIAGGDWGYVCDERLAATGGWFGENDNGAQLACKQMFGLGATGQRMHPVGIAGAGENMALHRVVCGEGKVSTSAGSAVADAYGLVEATGLGAASIPFGLDQCANTLPAHDDDAWGLMHPTDPYLTAPGQGLVHPATPEVCSDTEVAQVLCSFPDACNGHDLRSTANAEKQPRSFCRPPTGSCSAGEWEMPANGRAAPGAGGHFGHMGCCASCPGGASKCYGDCTCVCQTATSCAGVQPAQKNCQTAAAAEWKIGCRWDAGTRGCVDSSASPTAAPTPQPTARPTASPTRTSTPPPTAFPTVVDGYLGGDAICVLGYYPLWYTEAAAKASSLDGKAGPTVVGGHTFYMASAPAGGAWFGDYGAHGAAPRVTCIAAAPAAAAEPSGCSDIKTGGVPWLDALGATCGKYKLNAHWCERFGGRRDYSNAGYTANKACCVCGGGSTASPTPVPAPPTPPPTMSSTPPPTVPKATARPTQLECATARATRKQGRPCLTKCLKPKFWGKLPADAVKGPECDWCGKGELCILETKDRKSGRKHRCACKPTTDRRAAAVLEGDDEEEDDGDE